MTTDNRKITVCVPTYNRFKMTLEVIDHVLGDSRVSEVIISDDTSTDGSYEQLCNHFIGNAKVRLYRNASNQDCYWNKRIAMAYATNEWCILLDSDNIIYTDYLDVLYGIENWDNSTVYQPTWARPHFSFKQYEGLTIDKNNIRQYIRGGNLEVALNAMNFFINKQTYLDAFDPIIDPITSDSIYMAYRLLSMDNKYYFVPGLEYDHRVGHSSHYTENIHRTAQGFHQDIINKLANL